MTHQQIDEMCREEVANIEQKYQEMHQQLDQEEQMEQEAEREREEREEMECRDEEERH